MRNLAPALIFGAVAITAVVVLAIPATEPEFRKTTIFEVEETPTPIEAGPTPGWRRWRIDGVPIQARYAGETASGNIILELQDGTRITPRPEHCDVLSMNGSPREE